MKTLTVIVSLMFAGTLLAGCAAGITKQAGLDQNGNPVAGPFSANEKPGPGKGTQWPLIGK